MWQDEQQRAVYAWEDAWRHWNIRIESQRVLRYWIRQAERKYGTRPVKAILFPKNDRGHKVDQRSGKRLKLLTAYDPNNHTITRRPRHCNVPVARHEVAHAIHDDIFGDYVTPDHQPHGPVWLSIYLNLLIAAKIAPREALLASAKAAGIKWAPLGRTLPGRIRRLYRGRIRKMKAAAR
jgi:hypothetical protein